MPIVNSEKDFKRYKDYLDKSSYTKFYQDPSWAKVKNNWTCDFVYVEQPNKQIVAAMTVLGVKNKNGKHFYMPQGVQSAILEIINWLIGLLRKQSL